MKVWALYENGEPWGDLEAETAEDILASVRRFVAGLAPLDGLTLHEWWAYQDCSQTIWSDFVVYEVISDDEVQVDPSARELIRYDPEEPECVGKRAHTWKKPPRWLAPRSRWPALVPELVGPKPPGTFQDGDLRLSLCFRCGLWRWLASVCDPPLVAYHEAHEVTAGGKDFVEASKRLLLAGADAWPVFLKPMW